MTWAGVARRITPWFSEQALRPFLRPADSSVAAVARAWMSRGGHRWRPLLAVGAYTALRGHRPLDLAALRQLAVAVECFHKASLAHDDIEDGDGRRYGGPTLHAQHGVPIALNVGDYLIGCGYRLLADLPVDAACRADMLAIAARGHCELSLGQGEELAWRRRKRVLCSAAEVRRVYRLKTAPAFEVALRLGARLAGVRDCAVHAALRRYSQALGIGYQVRDDGADARRRRPGAAREMTWLCVAGWRGRAWAPRNGEPELVRRQISLLLKTQRAACDRALKGLPYPALRAMLREAVERLIG